MSQHKSWLPLLFVLSELKEYQRQIVLEALNEKSNQAIVGAITYLLKHGSHGVREKQAVIDCIRENKKDIHHLLSKKSLSLRKKKLAKFGGGPLGLILSAVIPLLLKTLLKK